MGRKQLFSKAKPQAGLTEKIVWEKQTSHLTKQINAYFLHTYCTIVGLGKWNIWTVPISLEKFLNYISNILDW